VRRRFIADVGVLYSHHDQAELQPDAELVWRHDAVIEAAMERGPALPVRFGTTLPDTEALVSALEPAAPRLRRQLEHVRGCVELAVRVGLPTPTRETPRDGREYVQLRLSDHRTIRTAAEQTLVPLDELAVCSRHATGDAATLKASYLVREDDVRRFADAVRALGDRHGEFSLSCTGPWPPYSFVGKEAA